jgi:hypothetical protein
MGSSTISLGLGLGGGKSATSSGTASGGGAWKNLTSVSFDGSDDYMSLGDSTIIQDSSSGAFTWSLWVKTSDAVGGMFIARSDQASGSNTGFRSFEMGSSAGSDTLYFVVKNAGGTTRYPYWSGGLSSSNISDGDWHNLVFVNEGIGGIMYIYFDGVSQTLSGNKSGLLSGTTTQPLSVGAMEGSNATGFYLDGIVDEVAAWDSALSSSQITNIYKGEESGGSGGTNGIPGDLSTFSPVGWWRMGDISGASGTTITDQGSGSNNGTLTNGPTFSTDVPS